MKTTPDQQARKRPVNLPPNEDLVLQARTMPERLSAVVEITIATWNNFGDKVNSFADEYSTL